VQSPSSPATKLFKADIGCGIDCEPIDSKKPIAITIRKSLIEQDVDLKLIGNHHTCFIEDCVTLEPPMNFIADPLVQFTVRRSSIHYYRIGGPSGRGNFPPDRLISSNILFDDCDFYAGTASGRYRYNGQTIVDRNDADLFISLKYDKGDDVELHFKNCRFHALSKTSGSTYVTKSDKTKPNAKVVFEGVIEIDAGLAEFPWQLRGQTVERRGNPTFRHAGFPAQTAPWQGESQVVES
jgi:hypothetical protein